MLEARGLEPRVLEPRVLEARAMEPRGLEPRGPGPNPRGPMPGGIQGPGPLAMGASGPQGPRQVHTALLGCTGTDSILLDGAGGSHRAALVRAQGVCPIAPGTAHQLGTAQGSGLSPPLSEEQEGAQELEGEQSM